jgi:hypothetical protein
MLFQNTNSCILHFLCSRTVFYKQCTILLQGHEKQPVERELMDRRKEKSLFSSPPAADEETCFIIYTAFCHESQVADTI